MEISYRANDFYTVSGSELSGNNIILKDAWGVDGSGKKYAWDSKYVISEDEYMKIESGWEASGKWINVDFDEMYVLKEEVYK